MKITPRWEIYSTEFISHFQFVGIFVLFLVYLVVVVVVVVVDDITSVRTEVADAALM